MLGGRRVTRFKKGTEQYDVIVQIADDARRTPEQLADIYVRAADGSMVQMNNLVTVRETVAAKELNHFNKLRAATISVGLAPGYTQGDALDWLQKALQEVAPGAQYDLSGQSREFRESGSSAGLMLVLALVFIYLVLSAQFESFVDPLVILVSVPLAVFGAFLCLKLLNTGADMHLWHDGDVLEHLHADRHRHADRPDRQARHPDRGVRQPAAGAGRTSRAALERPACACARS
jgi:multidrug efflux pump